jgi:hypothetical protein
MVVIIFTALVPALGYTGERYRTSESQFHLRQWASERTRHALRCGVIAPRMDSRETETGRLVHTPEGCSCKLLILWRLGSRASDPEPAPLLLPRLWSRV